MANVKTTDETAASTLDGTEAIRGVQAGGMVKIIVSQILAYIAAAKTFINPTVSGVLTLAGTGGATIDNSSASAGAISSSGGGQFDITAPIQLSGAVRDSAAALGAAGQVLKSNGSGIQTYGNDLGCYVLPFTAAGLTTVVDATTYYLGMSVLVLIAAQGRSVVYVPKAGTIKVADVMSYASTAGTSEDWTWGIAINNGAPTPIQTLGVSANIRHWRNAALNIAVAAGDYIELVTTTPTWATNPATLNVSGSIYIETALT